ncbi:unnamed protein product [Lupinus luteus]|uniref:Uncharacterized protein n=1 Tax=Lupinus luteus TaxID=3873 RepID=A0AAV1WB88_LUPLU
MSDSERTTNAATSNSSQHTVNTLRGESPMKTVWNSINGFKIDSTLTAYCVAYRALNRNSENSDS